MDTRSDKYIPAFHYRLLTPVYDFIMRSTMRESFFKRRLVEEARIGEGHRVLDLGCGTATLTVLIKEFHPEAEVIGLDGDSEILRIARSKVGRSGLNIALHRGTATDLPYAGDSFDRVVSSMVLHHLTRENKVGCLREAFRVLRPGGELHLADFGKPQNVFMHLISLVMRHLEETSDLIEGSLPVMLSEVGFDQVGVTARFMTVFGSMALYRARKPGSMN